jgi:GDP-L-fucose synthase
MESNVSPLEGRILVTGGGGFLGRVLIHKLVKLGARNLCAPRSRDIDLRDAVATRELFAREQPQLVFHLAARVGGIGANARQPGTFFHDNMAMGLHVLEQARQVGARVVIAGTVCAYPKHTPVPFREDDLWAGYPEETNAPYGIAKKALLVMAQAYRQEFGARFTMLFPANLYGPGDNFDLETSHVIPAMIRKIVEAKQRGHGEVVLWGDGTPTRDFLYVEDAARGLVLAAERYDDAAPLNLGTGRETSMRELGDLIANLVGYHGELRWDPARPNGQPRRVLDVSRARAALGFTATTSLEEGVARTIDWYCRPKEVVS